MVHPGLAVSFINPPTPRVYRSHTAAGNDTLEWVTRAALSHPVIGESSVLLGHAAPFVFMFLNILEKFEPALPSLKSFSSTFFSFLVLNMGCQESRKKSHRALWSPLGGSVGSITWADQLRKELRSRGTDPQRNTVCHSLNKCFL